VLDVIFLKGLYFEKLKNKQGMYGFSLYHDCETFRKKMLFHKEQTVIDNWLERLKYHCQFYDIKDFYTQQQRLGGGKFSDVFEATNKITNKPYALKKIDKTKLNPKEKEFLRDEI
jgi:serine/threonine protein kinase